MTVVLTDLRYIKGKINDKLVIFCTPKSSLQAFSSGLLDFIITLYFCYHQFKKFIICLISSHVGILGNGQTDSALDVGLPHH